jgi:hypothetical protein
MCDLPLALRCVALIAALAVPSALPAAALAHDISTAAGHLAEDEVVHTATLEKQLNNETRSRSAAAARAAAALVSPDPGQVGQWGPVVDWPVIAINAALLPNGKVLAYDSVGDGATESFPNQTFTRATVWDPNTGGQTDVRFNLGYNIFCSGFAHLMDGALFIAGGNKDQALNGLANTTYFNPDTNQWSPGPNMATGRWYPTVTALNNGEQLITSGGPSIPEVRQNNGTLRSLSNASLSLPLYPWFDVAPDGRAFYSGPDPTLRELDPRNGGSWQAYQQRDSIDRSYGGHALFDIGKELVAGGGPSTASAKVIDVNGSTPTVATTAPMAFGRRQHNLTVLADGTVLATGGNSSGASLVDLNAGVYNAELWNPATGTWRTLAAMQVTRQYHSTALLLPDGRVLSAGGGICGTCDQVGYLAKNAEIFSPPYLFDSSGNPATRPTITSAPSSVTYGQPFQVDTPNASSISKLALVRLGAVTHSVNMEQRYVPLSYTAGSSALNATAPANTNITPPGYYMLFAIDSNGVPSVAKFVRVDNPAPPPPPTNQPPTVTLTSPAQDAAYTAPAKIDLAATASDPDGTVSSVSFYNGSSLIATDTTAPYTYTWNVAATGTHKLTAQATDNQDATTTSSAVTITVGTSGGPPATITPPPVTPTPPTPDSSAPSDSPGPPDSSAPSDSPWPPDSSAPSGSPVPPGATVIPPSTGPDTSTVANCTLLRRAYSKAKLALVRAKRRYRNQRTRRALRSVRKAKAKAARARRAITSAGC